MSAELDRLFSSGDIARLLGVSRQRVHQLLADEESEFPAPIGRFGNYLVWRASEVERWAKRSGRAPGTAPKTRGTRSAQPSRRGG